METTVAANPGASAGSQGAEPSTALDNPSNLDFWEPGDDESPANPEAAGTDGIAQASEPAETNDGQEAEAGTETEETGEAAQSAVSDETEIDFNGEKLPLKELKLGYLRDKDYRFKTERISREGDNLRAQAARLEQSAAALADDIASLLPAEPPEALMYTNYPEYAQQKAIYDAALARVTGAIRRGQEAQQVGQQLSQAQLNERRNLAHEVLSNEFTEIRDPAKARAFYDTAFKAASEAGFTPQELQLYTDPRAFKMAWWAAKGMQAEKAKAKAQQKVQNVPPVQAPQKGKQPNSADRRNQEAMARLRKSGSKSDALKVDFE